MYRYIWLVPLLPLAGAAINGLLGRKLRFSEKLVGGIAVGSIALALLITLAAVYSYAFSNNAMWPQAYVTSQDGAFSFTWIPGGAVRLTQGSHERLGIKLQEEAAKQRAELEHGAPASLDGGGVAQTGSVLNVEWSYQLDALSSIFMLVVTGVGLCIFVFATGYMHGDPGFYRFFAYMGLFMFSMLVLVMGSNFLMMFVGWEGVGLCSYLLIGYYFDRQEAANASRKAFITNRIGDFGFALAIFGVIATFGTTQYGDVFAQASGYPLEPLGQWGLLSWIALGLFIGACGKSAQLPLHVWLPDAMAGPTPVSALIHAATMVTAGMFMACGVGAFAIGIFHVMTHAFFKALMFLGAGSVIHGMHHEQDMRRMGGLKKYMPYTYLTFMAGWLAICGIIPFSGFWSKDEILWNAAATTFIPYGWVFWLIGTIAATCTAFYMTRLMAMTFWGKPRFLELPAGGEADEAHAAEYDKGLKPHDARLESAGDRPRHEPGEYVGVPHAAPHDHHETRGKKSKHTKPHGRGIHEPHESPRSMWVPLAVLAVLAVVGGFVGISPAFTGGGELGGRL